MKDIFLKIKTEFEQKIKTNISKDTSFGLCYVAMMCLTPDEYRAFGTYMVAYLKKVNQKIFYTCYGVETKDSEQFIWNPKDTQTRLNWLDEQIAKN